MLSRVLLSVYEYLYHSSLPSQLYRHYTEDDEQPPVCFLQIPQLLGAVMCHVTIT